LINLKKKVENVKDANTQNTNTNTQPKANDFNIDDDMMEFTTPSTTTNQNQNNKKRGF